MNYLMMIFRSRNEALAMYEYLKARGVSCSTMNAPRSLMKSCGVAIRTNINESSLLKLINGYPKNADVKVYAVTSTFGGTSYRQIY